MGAVLAKIFIRCLTYLSGLIVVLVLIGMGAFVLARPQIDEFVNNEIKKRGIKAESWDIGFNGRANLYNVEMSIANGMQMKAALVSVRPPFAGFSGAATFHDLHLHFDRGNLSLVISELDISSISQREKDSEVPSGILQFLSRFDVGAVRADTLLVATDDGEGQEIGLAKLDNFELENLVRGRVSRIVLGQSESQPGYLTGQEGSMFRFGLVELRDLDVAATYAWITGQATDSPSGYQLVGALRLSDMKFDLANEMLHLSLGDLASEAFILTTATDVPLKALRDFIEARQRGDVEEQRQARGGLLQFLNNIKRADLRLDDVILSVPDAKISLLSLTMHSGDWEMLIPGQMGFALNGLVLDLTDMPGNIGEVLAATGYGRIEVSAAMEAGWDREKNRLQLEELSLEAANIGDVSLKLQLDDINPVSLTGMEADRGGDGDSWLHRLRLQSLDVGLKDRGAVANFARIIAGIGGVEPEEISQGLEEMARSTPPILFKDPRLEEMAREALLAFLQKSGRLMIHVASRSELGLELEKLVGEEADLQSLLSLADISFTHEEDSGNPG